MAEVAAEGESSGEKEEGKSRGKRRDIPGNFTYTTSPGVLQKILTNLREAERPETFSGDFMESVLGASGGSARAVPPILKRMKFLASDGSPTELYGAFQSDSGKSKAALEGLKNAFPSIFQKNKYAHKLDDPKIKDVIVEITGLTRSDKVVHAIIGTFATIQGFITDEVSPDSETPSSKNFEERHAEQVTSERLNNTIGLSYQINIVLPETTDIAVFNAIFKSLKENLL